MREEPLVVIPLLSEKNRVKFEYLARMMLAVIFPILRRGWQGDRRVQRLERNDNEEEQRGYAP